MKVRLEAFNGLRKMEMVSEDLLLQSLAKRVSGRGKQKESGDQRTSEQCVMLASTVAGALVHGLEDEFFEVSYENPLLVEVYLKLIAIIWYSNNAFSLCDCLIIFSSFVPDVKVRKSVCESLRTLTSLSAEFAREALDSLMDVLNDDSAVVRLQALETMHHMAINGRLKLHDKHLHMVCF